MNLRQSTFKVAFGVFSGLGVLLVCLEVFSQSSLSSGTLNGIIIDTNQAVISSVKIEVSSVITNYKQVILTDVDGKFRLTNIPFGKYQMIVYKDGFEPFAKQVELQSIVPLDLGMITLNVLGTSATVEITDDQNWLENVPTTETKVGQTLLSRIPVSSPASGLSDAIIQTSPGIATDANGFFHPLGDHAQTSIFLDNQPISDQQSTAFSTQLPIEAFESLTINTGTPNAEYGDKTSLVVDAVTRSALGLQRPSGSLTFQMGSFSTYQPTGTFGIGGKNWGNFSAFTFNFSKRFLDSPEFESLHNEGTSVNFFNRTDYGLTENDTLRLNFYFSRNFFETPNTFDQEARGQDQKQQVRTVNFAPGYIKILGNNAALTINPFYRRDEIEFLPSPNRLNDELSTLSQTRSLANLGFRSDLTISLGNHNAKFGVQATATRISEVFGFGITDANFNDPLSPNFRPALLAYDLTRRGELYNFSGNLTVKQQAVYAQDRFTFKNLTINAGLRFDNYRGIVKGTGVQPRIGVSYLIDQTKTILRASYARTMETPYNENLILSSSPSELRGQGGILGMTTDEPLHIGRRNQYNVGLKQQIGKYISIDADYFWKFTQNAYDFNVILNTPITFPIAWAQSKLDGLSFRVNLANYKNLSAFYVAGTSRARFFPPETGGLFFVEEIPSGVFRIDHEQKFQHSFQAQYQLARLKGIAPYLLFGWKYDSGLIAGEPADYEAALALTPNQQEQIGLYCGDSFATRFNPITSCESSKRGAVRLSIPIGEANDDHNPIRISPRHIFNLGAGTDNLFGADRHKIILRFNVLNLTNKKALYNFLSPFGGTHFVAPRIIQFQTGIRF